jgi:NADPH:quinone reductase-like Zn-dependent oxidoreductase
VIDHHRQDIADEIRPMTNNRGVDVVIEHVGEATWAGTMRSLFARHSAQFGKNVLEV